MAKSLESPELQAKREEYAAIVDEIERARYMLVRFRGKRLAVCSNDSNDFEHPVPIKHLARRSSR